MYICLQAWGLELRLNVKGERQERRVKRKERRKGWRGNKNEKSRIFTK